MRDSIIPDEVLQKMVAERLRRIESYLKWLETMDDLGPGDTITFKVPDSWRAL